MKSPPAVTDEKVLVSQICLPRVPRSIGAASENVDISGRISPLLIELGRGLVMRPGAHAYFVTPR